jgi:hypothetical protein
VCIKGVYRLRKRELVESDLCGLRVLDFLGDFAIEPSVVHELRRSGSDVNPYKRSEMLEIGLGGQFVGRTDRIEVIHRVYTEGLGGEVADNVTPGDAEIGSVARLRGSAAIYLGAADAWATTLTRIRSVLPTLKNGRRFALT